MRTIQGEIDRALGRLTRFQEVSTVGAGRTDAGVHALGQVVSMGDAPDDLDLERAHRALNSVLGPAIAVASCSAEKPDFNARFSARSRLYVYAVLVSAVPDPFLARTSLWHPTPLDLDSMNEAAGHLVGPHDFRSFGRVPDGASGERTLYELGCSFEAGLLRIRARANGFIQQMVRSLAGTLLQVGAGKTDPGAMPGVLRALDRSVAGPVAPAHGLCLVSVEYDHGWSRAI